MSLRVDYACEVIKYYKDPKSGIAFKVGTQGKIILLQEGKRPWARVGIPGVKDPVHIPKECLKGGSVPWNTEWTTNMDTLAPTVPTPMPNQDSDSGLLSRSIDAFLRALAKCEAPFMTDVIKETLGGEAGTEIAGITSIMNSGVHKAGLLEVLNRHDFSFQAMLDNAAHTIDDNYPKGSGGIYFRRYRDHEGEHHAYVGKAQDFYEQYQKYKDKPTGGYHDSLRSHPGTTDSVHVLCFLAGDNASPPFFVCEQVFICLLETYRPGILDGNTSTLSDRPDAEADVECASHLRQVYLAAATVSNWPGGTSRPTFGCKFGVEGEGVIPVANFRRTTPKTLHDVDKTKEGFRISVYEVQVHWTQMEETFNSFRFRPLVNQVDGIDAPRKNDTFQLVFEVRLDGKPHSRSWARLPHIGPFTNWNIANSWALRIEWRDPQGSWRSRYCQSDTPQRIPDSSRGMIDTYANGVGIMHFLFGVPLGPRAFITNLGFARVKQVDYNHLLKIMSYRDQNAYPNDLGSYRIPDNIIMQEMRKPQYKLQGVNIAFGSKSAARNRKTCDTCQLALAGAGTDKCVQKSGTGYNVCTNCYDLYGRPCCSWTPSKTTAVAQALVTQPQAKGASKAPDSQLQPLHG
ncbi:hypothetical protein BU24DRAFT_491356 [Aaosphaeria arxii CBS 175.79]|uniref:Uncharacterized protein n=1 Tax=Aaosphaeria arxii CBS 175.79 TaxID=1450172 RepID=A0A6A5XYL0_9PLEO|nr:uncharacterized protein BU24DRAFT_491356 [Aaosphaeria arxii CBS 175.79]KAF2018388.1 hypothetical protein BU24DRAFT_491356 [Aaosphaeria arxii CBS 175.79]